MNDSYNNPINHNDELMDMQRQLAQLKERLDRTTTINEDLMLQSIKQRMRGMHRKVHRIVLVALLCCPLWLALGLYWGLSWPFIAFTMVMLATSAFMDWRVNRFDPSTIDNNIAQTIERLVKMKKTRARVELIAIPVVIVWFAWLVWEFLHTGIPREEAIGIVIGSGVGGIIGGIIGWRIFKGLQRDNDDMLSQLRDLQS